MIVSSSPHIHTPRTTRSVMADVLIALAPATVAAVVLFGLSALWLVLTCTAAAVLSGFLFCLAVKKPHTVGDLSAAVTGLLLALNLPASTPLWQGALGAVFAVVAVKMLFGGIGKNFANPAIAARVMMLLAFTGPITATVWPQFADETLVSSATPLAVLGGAQGQLPALTDMLLGLRAGAIGETCGVALLAGFVYLLVRRVITWHTPVIFVGTVFAFTLAVTGGDVQTATYHVLSGGLLIGAVFMATDYTTSPFTPWGKVIFAVGCGLITAVIRLYGSYPEGVSFAILCMNILNPYIEKWTMRRPLGGAKA